MNNNNGAISFDAWIETSDFKKQIDEIEARIVGLGNTASDQGDKMEDSFKKVGGALAAYFSFDALKGLTQDVVRVRGEFQKMEAVLTNTLGSGSSAAAALEMISNFGATTPFQVDELTASFIKLANQGFVPTEKELTKLGDLASSMGKSFDQLTEAVIDAQTGEFERLKEFGIRASKEGNNVTFTFKEQKTVVENSASAIRDYILSLGAMNGVAGANAQIAATMAGQISNLEDAWTSMLNEIGKSNEGVISEALSGAASLVANYETVINILKVLVLTYGTYKAAVMVATAVQAAAAAGVGALTAAETLHYAALVICEKAQKLLNATMLANPYVLAATLLTGLITSVVLFSDSADAAAKSQEALNKATEAGEKAAAGEIAKIERLTLVIQAETTSREQKNEALKELRGLNPDILGGLTEEAVKTGEAKAAIDQYVASLRNKIELQQLEKELADSITRENEAKAGKNDISFWKKMFLAPATSEANIHGVQGPVDFAAEARKELNAEIIAQEAEVQKKIKERIAALVSLGNQADKTGDKEVRNYKTVGDRITEIKEKVEELEKKRLNLKAGDTSGISEINRQIAALNKEKNDLEGKGNKKSLAVMGSLDYYKQVQETARKSLSALSTTDAEFATKQAALLATIADAEKKIEKIEAGQASFADQLQAKKKLYEEYYDWVQSLGRGVADAEFADLIREGDTFSAYIDKKIAELEAKRQDGTLTNQEADNLVTLNTERESFAGVTSGIEAFRESLAETKREASDLVVYLEAVRKKQKELEGDNSSEGLEKKSLLKVEEKETTDELASMAKDLTQQYAEGADRIRLIQDDLHKDLAVLDNAYLTAKTAAEREQIERIIEARKEAANIEMLQADVDWGKALGNPEEVSLGSLQKLRDRLIEIVNEASEKFSPEGLQTITEAIAKINNEITDRAPMQALQNAYDGYKESLEEVKEIKEEIKRLDKEGKADTKEMAEAEDKLASAENKRRKNLSDLNTSANKLGAKGVEFMEAAQAVADMLAEMGIELPESVGGAIDGLSQVANSLASIDLSNPVSIVTGAAGAIGGVVKTLTSIFGGGSGELSEKVFKRYENLISVLDQVIDRQKELLSGKVGSDAIKQYSEGVAALEKQIAAAQKMGYDWLHSGASKGFLGIGSSASHGTKQYEALRKYKDELAAIGINLSDLGKRADGLFDLTAEQLKMIQEEAPEAWAALDDNTKEYLQTIIDANEELDELEASIRENLTGISFDDAKNSLRDLILDTDATLEDVAGKMKEYMRDAVASIIIDKTLNSKIEGWYKAFAEAMSDDELTREEEAALQNMYNALYDQAVKLRDKAFAAAGITPEPETEEEEETSSDPLAGSVQSLTEETGSAVAGQITMMRIICAEQLENMKQSLLLLSEIAVNTRYCSYLAKLERIVEILEGPTASDDLRSKGLV